MDQLVDSSALRDIKKENRKKSETINERRRKKFAHCVAVSNSTIAHNSRTILKMQLQGLHRCRLHCRLLLSMMARTLTQHTHTHTSQTKYRKIITGVVNYDRFIIIMTQRNGERESKNTFALANTHTHTHNAKGKNIMKYRVS